MSDIMYFTADHVRRLTGLSAHQLRHWDRAPDSAASPVEASRRVPHSHLYSFRDLVRFWALAELRRLYRLPIPELRRVSAALAERANEPWTQLTLFVVGKQVFFPEERDAAAKATRAAHVPMTPIDLGRIEQEAREAARSLWERAADDVGRIVRRSGVVGGRPVLAGTRLPTSAIWEFHVAGYPREAILREYPGLMPQDVDAAIAFEQERLSKTG